jgi:hypothetical protein
MCGKGTNWTFGLIRVMMRVLVDVCTQASSAPTAAGGMGRVDTEENVGVSLYRLSPELAVERFGEEALILLETQDRFLTVNRAAADLAELIESVFAGQLFAAHDLVALLVQNYELEAEEAAQEAQALIEAWLEQGLFVAAT